MAVGKKEKLRLKALEYARNYRERYKAEHGISPEMAWRASNPKHYKNHLKYMKERWNRDPEVRERHKIAALKNRLKTKIEVFSAYGGVMCICCGESDIRFLTIDHKYNDGAEERRLLGSVGGGMAFYRYLKRLGYPDGYQVLCYNCNCGKRINGGRCPHEDPTE